MEGTQLASDSTWTPDPGKPTLRAALRRLALAVRRRLPTRLRRFAFRLGRFFGPEHDFPSVEGSLRALKSWGFAPRTAIDVGAYDGEWTAMFKEVYPQARVLMVEAQRSKAERLMAVAAAFRGSVEVAIALLSSTPRGNVRFVVMGTGSSVFEEASPYSRSYEQLDATTLDALVSSLPAFSAPDFIKLDVQGYELEILKGAASAIAAAECVLMEASLVRTNAGCPLLAEVILFMQDQGFQAIDFCSHVRRRDRLLWQTDILFARPDAKWLPGPTLDERNW